MYRLFSIAGIAAALAFTIQSGQASTSRSTTGESQQLGAVPSRTTIGDAGRLRPRGVSNLQYHAGGSVQTGSHTTYAIYWGAPETFSDSGYQSTINRYFQDVAAASGRSTNVYFSDTQYYQTIGGVKTPITYSEQFGGSYVDAANPTSKGCSSTAGGTVGCVSDAQIQQEVQKAISANGWPDGQGSEFFVFLGKGISTCYGSSCFVRAFCAYHSSFTDSAGHDALYANMPYTGFSLNACGSGQSPNGDAAADSTLNVTSHEANETITDWLGDAWYDNQGNENGDKCAWQFGTTLGKTSTGSYNQVINGHDYYLQGEWSNNSSHCVWSGT